MAVSAVAMSDWRAIGYGVIVFLIALITAISKAPPWILATGFPSGLVAGYRRGSILGGLLYGFVVGCCNGLLLLGGVYYIVSSTNPTGVYPGVGFGIVGVFLIAVFLTIESILAGAVGGILG